MSPRYKYEALTQFNAKSSASGVSAAATHGDAVAPLRLLDDGYEQAPAHTVMYELSAMCAMPSSGDPEPRLTPASDDYNPKVAITALMRILRDPSLAVHHGQVTQAVQHIFQNLKLRCVPFLREIIPVMLHAVRHCEPALRASLLLQLAGLTKMVKQHLHAYLPHMFELVMDFWSSNPMEVMSLVDDMSRSVRDKFKPFLLHRFLPLLLAALTVPQHATVAGKPLAATRQRGLGGALEAGGEDEDGAPADGAGGMDTSPMRLLLVLRSLERLKSILRERFHLLVPAVLRLIDQLHDQAKGGRGGGGSTQITAKLSSELLVKTVTALAQICDDPMMMHDATGLAPRYARTLLKLLSRNDPRLDLVCVQALTVGARQMGFHFLPLAGMVKEGLARHRVASQPFDDAVADLVRVDHKRHGNGHNAHGGAAAAPLRERDNEPAVFRERGSVGSLGGDNGDNNDGGGGGGGDGDGGEDGMVGVEQEGERRLPMNQNNLKRAWDVTQWSTAEDWDEWIRRFSVELLRESPAPSLRACSALAQVHATLARELFHAAFVSCWFELSDAFQENLVRSLEAAFSSDSIPPEILQMLLNLAEFCEHDAEALPIDIRTLSELAKKCHAHAKALHYKEQVFQKSPESCVEDLISINKKLDQPEAARGILDYAQKRMGGAFDGARESFLSKLANWDEALGLYRSRLEKAEGRGLPDAEAVLGTIKCLDAVGEWDGAVRLCFQSWGALNHDDTKPKVRKKAATVAARAAWALGRWADMEALVASMAQDKAASEKLSADNQAVEGPFFKAVLAVHAMNFDAAAQHIDVARQRLCNTLSALMSESYKRAYTSLVQVQQLSELEEVVQLKKLEVAARASSRGSVDAAAVGQAQRARARLSSKWDRRLRGCRLEVSAWQRILKVRSLVLSSEEDVGSWIKFASLCRQDGNFALAETILTRHLALPGQPISVGDLQQRVSAHLAQMGFDEGQQQAQQRALMQQMMQQQQQHMVVSQRVRYAFLKHLWAANRGHEALVGMHRLAEALSPHVASQAQRMAVPPPSAPYIGSSAPEAAVARLLVKVHLKVGDWEQARLAVGARMDQGTQTAVLDAYRSAMTLDDGNYKAWHSWAMVNFNIMEQLRSQADANQQRRPGQPYRPPNPAMAAKLQRHLIVSAANAAQGFLRAVSLGRKKWSGSVQTNLLKLLNVWFWYGNTDDVAAQLASGFVTVSLDSWLGVLPQLIARIDVPNARVRDMLHTLLARLGRSHPQALVYPLAVALKSRDVDRRAAAEKLFAMLTEHSAALVTQARAVSQELIRVAILWHELWHEGLEEASRLYFGDGNVRGMLDLMLTLHDQIASGAATLREASFQQAFGKELAEARVLIQRYQLAMEGTPIPTRGVFIGTIPGHQTHPPQGHAASNEPKAILDALWDTYYTVFRRISKLLPLLNVLELQDVSPYLLQARNLELAVPGTYRVDRSKVRITMFGATVAVITSKQRPRKIEVNGEDGRVYVFLLKGHEDLRQDERAMQLFGLANALLESDRRTNKHDLAIQRYAVVPLSHVVGVVGWVPQTDTLHALIKDFRESRKILLNIEHRLMQQMAPDFENLTVMGKLEVFEAALEDTAGQDLNRVLWLKSSNAEQWLDRRTCYTRSLAVMSMVGYILGLGDRHPSNLMLDRSTGKVLHIDFGDCFDVAMLRDKFPEKVPFRLTRMMVNAMEVSGIEGNYRSTCQHVMSVLRDNRNSLLALLQAFVHDPLFSWRLLGASCHTSKHSEPYTLAPTPTDASAGQAPTTAAITAAGTAGSSTGSSRAAELNQLLAAAVLALEHEADQTGERAARLQGEVDRCRQLLRSQPQAPHAPIPQRPSAEGSQAAPQATSQATVSREGSSGEGSAAITAGDAKPRHVMPEISAPESDDSSSSDDEDDDERDGVGYSVMDARYEAIQSLANSHVLSSSHHLPASLRVRSLRRFMPDNSGGKHNEKALAVIRRVQDKLSGRWGQHMDPVSVRRLWGDAAMDESKSAFSVAAQVDMLIRQATSNERLCQCFVGWCPFW